MPGQILDAVMHGLAFPVAGGILVNHLDELFIDANYYLRGLNRRKSRLVSKKELRDVKQKRIAIMVPAWRESEVIERMLLHNLKTLDYDPDRYVIFCGTYKNDAETQACVDAVARRFRSVRKVVVPHDGPTSKADCLNWIYRGILLEEIRRGQRFDILLMQDAEDVVHPLALRLYSLLIPEHEFVQTPVFSLDLSTRKLVAGTYIDEFAEHHLKDMLVRQAIGGLVPSAGVGTAFCRNAFEEIAKEHGQLPFNTESLTEDYEIGLKLRLANRKVAFACRTILSDKGEEEYIATREYFPDGLRASVRQRSRWICGITLQTWAQIGWKGSLPVLYCLWRDRKAPLMNAALCLGYVLLLYVVARSVLAMATGGSFSAANIIPVGSVLFFMVLFNLSMLAWRSFVKLSLVHRLYGLGHGLMSFPRLIVSNVINVAATSRAVWQYAGHAFTGKPLRWLKTTHAFPTTHALEAQHRRLGEILADWHLVTESSLGEALAVHEKTKIKLGRVLVSSKMASHRAVAQALADQWGLEMAELDPRGPSLSLLRALPEPEAERLHVLPLGEEGRRVVLAAPEPLSEEDRSYLEARFDREIVLKIAPDPWLDRARLRTYRRLHDEAERSTPRLGEWLLAHGYLSPRTLTELLDEHWESGRFLGELALARGLIDIGILQTALHDLDAKLVRLDQRDIDNHKIDRLGVGFCALYGLVPLQKGAFGIQRAVASVHPLHRDVVARIEKRLEGEVTRLLAPHGDVLGAVGRRLATSPHGRASLYGQSFDVESFLQQVGLAGDETGASEQGQPFLSGAAADLLPARLVNAAGIRIEQVEGKSLVLSCEKPRPRLSRELNWLLPEWKIAWRARSHHENGGRRHAIESGKLAGEKVVA